MPSTKTSLIIGAFVLIVGLLLSWNKLFPPAPVKAVENVDPSTLAGIQTGSAPWQPELQNLRSRLSAIGLPALGAEGQVLHIHQHLDIFIEGTPIPVPASIGINQAAAFISTIHTHDTRGVIHIESPTVQTFTLGQFFDIWGVRFTASCIGAYCADATHALSVYSNGKKVEGDPRALPLTSHEEIAIYYGSASSTPAKVPSSYQFAAGE